MTTPRPNVTSPKELRRLLAEYNVQPSKRLGQSFLIDANVVSKILAAADIRPQDRVFEVGPGAGALTTALTTRAREVVALELDRRLVELLTTVLGDAPNVRIVQGNILKTDLRALLGGGVTPLGGAGASAAEVKPAAFAAETAAPPEGILRVPIHSRFSRSRPLDGGPWKLLANLPYSIIGPAIARLLENRAMFPLMVLMAQREVAERLAAAPTTKQYGVLSLLVQAHMAVENVGHVSRTCFYPQPQVDSTLVRLAARDESAIEEALETTFVGVVRAVFRQRRKTMLNALTVAAELELTREEASRALDEAGIDPGRRPGALSAEEFAALARAIGRAKRGADWGDTRSFAVAQDDSQPFVG
jgi:16S rRNA (adenine1518-N6/adenine1519-N6)-dimethyltransferase